MAKTRSSPKTDLVLQHLATHPGATTSQIVTDLKAHGISESLVAKVRQKVARKGKRGAKKRSGRTAAARTTNSAASGANGSKAAAIHEIAGSLKKPFRPRDVRDVLAERGIHATTSVIGKVLRSMGLKRKRRRKAAAGAAPAATANSAALNINDLVAAKKLVEEVGGIEKVREALATLSRLG